MLLGVGVDCKLLYGCWKLNSVLLREQQVLVAAEPSLSPLIEIFIEMILAREREGERERGERETERLRFLFVDQDGLEPMPLLPQCCTTMPSTVWQFDICKKYNQRSH